MQISGSVAIVTGGASGLGQAVVEMLVQGGGRVGVIDLPSDSNATAVQAFGDSALFVAADVRIAAQVEAAIAETQRRFGALQIGVNCAGIAFAIKTLQRGKPSDLDTFEMTLQVNLLGTFNVCRLAASAMAEGSPNSDGERGVLINTSSVAAFEGQIGQVAYSASKGGIVAMTLPMARDLSQYGIRVMTIAPGIFDTPLLSKLPEAARVSLAEQVPFPRRLGKPSEFSALARHILENPMLNGEVIRLDGALRMGIR